MSQAVVIFQIPIQLLWKLEFGVLVFITITTEFGSSVATITQNRETLFGTTSAPHRGHSDCSKWLSSPPIIDPQLKISKSHRTIEHYKNSANDLYVGAMEWFLCNRGSGLHRRCRPHRGHPSKPLERKACLVLASQRHLHIIPWNEFSLFSINSMQLMKNTSSELV